MIVISETTLVWIQPFQSFTSVVVIMAGSKGYWNFNKT